MIRDFIKKMILKHNFRLIDIITLVFVSIKLILVVAAWNILENPLYYLSGYLIIFIIAFYMRKLDPEKFCKFKSLVYFVKNSYPLLFLAFFFEASTAVDRVIFRDYLDPFFIYLDEMIFGYQPSIQWGLNLSGFLWQEIFHFAYFSYYLMIAFTGVYFFVKQRKYFDNYVFNLSFVFFICYTTYSVFPVAGARFIPEALDMTQIYRAGPFTHLMVFIYRLSNHFGGAFPSSHVAIATVITLIIWKKIPSFKYIQLFIYILLSFSTVICHYHYFIDTVFGVIYGIFFYYLSERIFKYYSKVDHD